jgi:hypothetical protein
MKIIKWNNTLKESLLSYIHESAKIKAAQIEFLKSGHKGKASQLGDVSKKDLEDVRRLLNPSPEENKKKLNEKEDRMIAFRKRIDAMRLVPTRSGSKGDEE